MGLDRENYFFTPRYTRGQICKVLGVTIDKLRHYEKCGIVRPHENEKNGYKYYSIADIEILNVILFLRAMDVSIKEIPNFINCKNTENYECFLGEQIKKADKKINYWRHVRNTLSYLKKILEDYEKSPHNINIEYNTKFRFKEIKFDYENYDIKKMAPSKISSINTYHVIKLKIVGEKWISSNREDMSDFVIAYLYGDNEFEKDIKTKILPVSLKITALEKLEEIPKIIMNIWKEYHDKYEFEYKAYIIDHTFFNIFNQEKLLRNIYLPIKKVK